MSKSRNPRPKVSKRPTLDGCDSRSLRVSHMTLSNRSVKIDGCR
jgi:hypothetical protein